MLRSAAIACLTSAVVTTAAANERLDLAVDLEHFIADFDLSVLDDRALQKVEAIIEDADASHGQKVLALHTVLEQNNALAHVDVHGAQNLLTAEMR